MVVSGLKQNLRLFMYIALGCVISAAVVSGVDTKTPSIEHVLADLCSQPDASAKAPSIERTLADLCSQSDVVRVVAEALAAEPRQAVATVQAAIKAVPSEAALVLATAMYMQRAAADAMLQAAIAIVPAQAAQLRKVADMVLALVADPTPSGSAHISRVVRAEITAAPEMAPAVVSTSIVVCSFLNACSQFDAESVARTAVASNRGVAETVVGTMVRLVPDQASTVVAAVVEETMMASEMEGPLSVSASLPAETQPPSPPGTSSMHEDDPFIAPRPNPVSPFFFPVSPAS